MICPWLGCNAEHSWHVSVSTNTKQESDEFIMEENRYFQDALARFTHEAANGGAIRHLTDMGYTVEQIRDKLDFPAPYERVQQAVWQRLEDTGVILREEPGKGKETGGIRRGVLPGRFYQTGKLCPVF